MATINEIYEIEHGRETRGIHEFKVAKRLVKGIENPVTFIGFPKTSLDKWLPKEAQIEKVDDKHIVVGVLGDVLASDSVEETKGMFDIWKDNIEETAPSKPNSQNGFLTFNSKFLISHKRWVPLCVRCVPINNSKC